MGRKIRITAILAATVGALLSIAAPANSAPRDSNSPGVASGNVVQAPVDVPVNACGNTVNVVGLLNPAQGNTCVNE